MRPLRLSYFVFLALLILPGMLQAQPSRWLRQLGHWDNDNIPSFGGQTFSSLWGWTSPQGQEYAIIGSVDSIYFIDISDPAKPKVRDVEAGKVKSCSHREFKTYKNYCYAVSDRCSGSAMQIFDLKYLPDSVHKVYETDSLSSSTHNLFVENDRLYMASNARSVWEDGIKVREYHPLTIASLADPERPRAIAHMSGFVGSQRLFNEVHDLFVRNDTGYLSNGDAGLFIYNLSSPLSPRLIQQIQKPYPQAGFNHNNAITPDGNYLYFTDENHFTNIKVYDISAIKQGGSDPDFHFEKLFGLNSELGSLPHNVFVNGSLLYASYYQEGVLVFDITHPKDPVLIAKYDTYLQNDLEPDPEKKYAGFQGCWNVYPFFKSGSIIASDMTNGLYVLRLDTGVNVGENAGQPADFRAMVTRHGASPVLQLDLKDPGNFRLSILDMNGRTLLQENRWHAGGKQEIPMQFNSGPGMYLIRLETASGAKCLKLLR